MALEETIIIFVESCRAHHMTATVKTKLKLALLQFEIHIHLQNQMKTYTCHGL